MLVEPILNPQWQIVSRRYIISFPFSLIIFEIDVLFEFDDFIISCFLLISVGRMCFPGVAIPALHISHF